ncbi:MAG: hypothetical protein IKN24_04210 [Lachnospiraceae bacterium]|nr:hypothetical protein [Lachnospiraceae bacterium]
MSFGEKDIKLRDFVLAVCSLLNLIEGECDEALKLFGFGILNREDERDSAIIKYLNNEKQTELKFEDKLKDFCEYLARNGFEALKIREREKNLVIIVK